MTGSISLVYIIFPKSECAFILLFNVLTAHPSGNEFGEGAGSSVIHMCVPLLSRVSLLKLY